jgi:hypothetical protein
MLRAQSALTAVVICLLWVVANRAQTAVALSGVAKDAVGWTVSGVEVSSRDTNTNRVRKTKTDDTGHFEFRDLPLGEYVVEASKLRFKPKTESVTLRDGTNSTRLDLILELGDISEEITVWGDKPDESPVGPSRRLNRGKVPECSPKAVAAKQGGIVHIPRKVANVVPSIPRRLMLSVLAGGCRFEGCSRRMGR